jgi:hypothetical protein
MVSPQNLSEFGSAEISIFSFILEFGPFGGKRIPWKNGIPACCSGKKILETKPGEYLRSAQKYLRGHLGQP